MLINTLNLEVVVDDPDFQTYTTRGCVIHYKKYSKKQLKELVAKCAEDLFDERMSLEINIYEMDRLIRRTESRRLTYEVDFPEQYAVIRKRQFNPNSGMYQLNGTVAMGEKIQNPLKKLIEATVTEIEDLFQKRAMESSKAL